jgi:hypothetical protein
LQVCEGAGSEAASAAAPPMIAWLEERKADALLPGQTGREAARIVSIEQLGDAACRVV